MQKRAVTASMAMAFLGVTLCGCATQQLVSPYATVLNNQNQPNGRICNVGDQGCLAMMASPPRTCLIDSGHCNANGRVQMIDPNTGVTPEPEAEFRNPVTIDAK